MKYSSAGIVGLFALASFNTGRTTDVPIEAWADPSVTFSRNNSAARASTRFAATTVCTRRLRSQAAS
jgi:hypothetical protein